MVYTPDHTDTDTDTPPPLMLVDINAPYGGSHRQNRCRNDTRTHQNLVRKCLQFGVVNTARNGHGKKRTRPVYKLTKRQDNLELSYLCSIFVLLKEWQGKPTKARQGDANKARQGGVVTTPRHGKFTCCGIVKHGKSVYNLEMHDLQFGIVISL